MRISDWSSDVCSSDLVRRELISEDDKAAALKRVATGLKYEMFKDCDFVVEAATENEAVKREIYKTLVPNLTADALLATNTSTLSTKWLGAVTDRHERFLGMQFMNTVPKMKPVQ